MLFLVLAFILLPILELWVIIEVGQWIGLWPTLGLLLLDSVLGAVVLRHEGRGAWRRLNEALAQRRFPGKEVADGVLIVIGGTLLLVPGFVTDAFGLVLLIPPTRALVRALLTRLTVGRFAVVGLGGGAFGRTSSEPGPREPTRDYDYDVSAEEMTGEGETPELPQSGQS